MAVVTETVPALDLNTQTANLEIYTVAPDGMTSLNDRYRMRQSVCAERSDGLPGRDVNVETPITDAAISTFTAGDAAAFIALLNKIYDHAKAQV